MTAAELLAREQQAARYSDDVARAFDDGRATYRELIGAEEYLHRCIVARCQAEELEEQRAQSSTE